MGYELLFERLGIHPHENLRFLELFEKITEYFGEKQHLKSLQKVMIESSLTNPTAFEGLCAHVKALKMPSQDLRKPKSPEALPLS